MLTMSIAYPLTCWEFSTPFTALFKSLHLYAEVIPMLFSPKVSIIGVIHCACKRIKLLTIKFEL